MSELWQAPWVWLLLPLPWLVRRWLAPVEAQQRPAFVPFAAELMGVAGRGMPRDRRNFRLWLALLAWLLLVAAAARPQWIGAAVELPVSGRDLMLAVDISGSMQIKDFEMHGRAVDRLTATKSVADAFIRRREGDRIGLILFGSNAYVQAPLTFDRQTVIKLLDEAVVGLAGKATAIGDAIGLAVKRMVQGGGSGDHQVLILLTDGVNTAGAISPQQATELAKAKGLVIYTIGIGADEMMVQSFFGVQRVNPSADLDEGQLRRIARETGGRYFRAHDRGELQQIYHLIDQLEPVARESHLYRPHHALFVWPLAVGMLLLLLIMASMLPALQRRVAGLGVKW